MKVLCVLFAIVAVIFYTMVCSVCGRDDHRIEKCKHPAAKEILKLRAEVKALGGSQGCMCINMG